jgi:sec-independent protein translocase protein TatC
MATADPDLYQGEPLPLVEHLREFRNRFIVVLVAVVAATALCIPFADDVLQAMVSLLRNKPLALDPTATLIQYIKVALVGGIALSIPVILYEIIAFLLPALRSGRSRRPLFLYEMLNMSIIYG